MRFPPPGIFERRHDAAPDRRSLGTPAGKVKPASHDEVADDFGKGLAGGARKAHRAFSAFC
jgi:hypothetical protein